MCIVFSMDIQKINKRHYIATDMYYRISLGLSSKLLKYENGIIYLEITLSKKWTKNYNATAAELAYSWKSSHPELCKALGCKVLLLIYVKILKDNFYRKMAFRRLMMLTRVSCSEKTT
ncbi:MAG: hypothetical protein IPL63_16675 [Saprospiraceae bacterium]|nr:hypothetical protein [Saprospiraceae bacterium]